MPGALPPTTQSVTPQQVLPAGPADQYFDAGVQAFEKGHYSMAATSFQQAMAQAPEDRILPFAYAQALFAAKRYQDAISVLQLALVMPDKDGKPLGVFYPRGLYPDDDTLYTHIDLFMDVQEKHPQDPGYQFLLGYHLLGIGEITLARDTLEPIRTDATYGKAVDTLLDLADRLEEETPVALTE